MKPELSIIVTHFRKPEMLRLCLDSIKEDLRKSNLGAEIIVSDGMTMQNTKMMMSDRFSDILFLPHTTNVGYSKLVNAAIQKSTGNYILILNSDLIVGDNSIKILLDYIKKNKEIGMIGPRLLHFNGEHQQSFFRYYTPATIIARRTPLGRLPYFKKAEEDFLMTDCDPQDMQTPDWLMGSAMMVSREAIRRVGLMDGETFFMYFEDVDWCRRFWHNGFIVLYYPKAIMYHYLGRGSKSKLGIFDALFNKKTHWHIKSALRFFWKYRNLGKVKQGPFLEI